VELTRRPRRSLPARRGRGLNTPEGRTLIIGGVAAAITAAVAAGEIGRVWRRGSAPLPSETDAPLQAAEEAVAETVEAAVAGFQEAPTQENALFNLLASFVVTFCAARGITHLLRENQRVGPFKNMIFGRRHIHHFVPGIVLTFIAGTLAITTHREALEPKLAIAFGAGMGMTLDESALLLELDDVYWSQEGLISVQITLAVIAFLGALLLGARFVRRGEDIVLDPAQDPVAA
jgi:hypothetical protein